MASVILDFYDEDAPNTLLGSLEDDDLESLEHRPALFDLGALVFRVPKAVADDNATLLRKTNLVRVRYPTPHGTTRKWAGVLKDFKTVIISHGEQHGEYVEWTAPGALFMWSYAALGTASTVSDQPARGSFNDVPAREWIWVNEPYGAIATRLFEEGRHNPYPGAAAADSPLEDWDITFDRVNDSAGNPWANIAEEFRVPIGANVLEVLSRLATAGDFFLVVDADLTLHAYQEYADWATDRTGSFGAGNVRWEKSVNILTELSRSSEAIPITHLIQRDSDGNTSTEEAAGYTSGREHFGYVEADSTNDDATLNKIAQRAIDASGEDAEQFAFEVIPGNDEANGEYFPWLHYDLADLVTVHTGTSGYDLDEASLRLVAWRIVLDEASESDNAQQAYRSLHVVPELAYRPFHTYSAIRDSLGDPGSTPGCPCLRFCQEYAGTGSSDLLYPSNDASGLTLAVQGAWDDDNGPPTVRLLKVAPDGDFGAAHQIATSIGGDASGRNVLVFRQAFELTADLAAKIAAGTLDAYSFPRVRARFGIGISEAAQQIISQDYWYVWNTAGGGSVVGVARDLHAAGGVGGNLRWPPQSTKLQRRFPPESEDTGFSAVPGTAAGHWLVWEAGYKNFTDSGETSGASVALTTDAGTDLPAAEGGSSALDTWVNLEVSGEGALDACPIMDTVRQGLQNVGESPFPAHADHEHAHGLLFDAIASYAANYHDIRDLGNYVTFGSGAPTAGDDVLDGHQVGTHWIDADSADPANPDIYMAVDVTAGAAVWTQLNGGGGGGAPSTADYLVGTAQAGLSAEIVVGTTPGGELGGSWASPTVDTTHAGSNHLQPVRKNSTGSDTTRRRLNLIEGTNVTITIADDAGNDEVDITIDGTHTHAAASFVSIAKWGND